MAEDIDKKLLKCGILDKLKVNSQKYLTVKDSKNLIATFEQHLFVWHEAGSSILTTDLSNEEVHKKALQSINFNFVNGQKHPSYTTLTLTSPPVFEVESIEFNQTGGLLSLSGKHGVTIYEVPWRYGKFGTSASNSGSIVGRSWNIAELFFICTNRVQVVQTAWHPGSLSKTHLTVLSTDNYIRIYDVNDPQVPEQAISLQGSAPRSSFLSSESKITFSSCYGENAVSFDFGPPENTVLLQTRQRSNLHSSSGQPDNATKTVWPIYYLQGNGDVFILRAPLKKEKPQPAYRLEGPLPMYPPAEDNYGYDACALLCLHSTPTALVIATATGILYHCLLLDNGGGHIKEQNDVPEECEEGLYVFESIELPLTLTEEQDDLYTNPIRLHKDIVSHSKYHCTHVSGLHSVAVPFLQTLNEYSDECDLKRALSDLPKQGCIVEHILCTKPFSQMKAVPVLGCDCTVTEGGHVALLCLLATWEFVSFSIVSSFLPPLPQLLSEEEERNSSDCNVTTTFSQSLERAVKRSLCSPLLKANFSKDTSSPQQWLDLLCSITQRFREDYVQRLCTAHALLRSRLKVLSQQKEYQLSDFQHCEQEMKQLARGTDRLLEKHEAAQNTQQEMQKRIEDVLKKLQLHLPYLSKAETEMKQTLLNYEERMKTFDGQLDHIKKKLKYQKEKLEEFNAGSVSSSSPLEEDFNKNVSFNETQTKHVKELLSQEGDSIAEMKRNVNSMKKQLGLV